MKWYQVAAICLMTLTVTINLVKHGEYTESKYNFFVSLTSGVIWATLLYFGGFWR